MYYEYMAFSPEILKKLMNSGEITKKKKGEYIFRDKFPVESIYILLDGKVSICKLCDQGQQKTIFILDGIVLLNEPVETTSTASVDCIAFEDSTVLSITKKRFFDLLSKDFELTKIVIEQISHKTRRMYRQLKNSLNTVNIEKRLAAKLWKLCRDYGITTDNEMYLNIDVSTIDLAELIGVRRETLSRALKVLQDEGLIRKCKRKIYIPNPEALSKYFKET